MKTTPTMLPSITHAISKQVLSAELTADKLIRTYKGLEIYLVTADDTPRVMTEIGRIREVEFRREGGGTGKPKDIDIFDYGPIPYRQLVVWDPVAQEIVAMYRYILCRDVMHSNGSIELATAQLFDFSQPFRDQYLPNTIELDRSVVNRSAKRRRLGLFAVWCGLGALVQEYPGIDYFFGKVTIAPTYSRGAQGLLLQFIEQHRPDREALVSPKANCRVHVPTGLHSRFEEMCEQKAFNTLKSMLKQLGESMPSILNSYLKISNQLRYFGSVYNRGFGNVIEAAILIPIDSIKTKPLQQFIASYTSLNSQRFRALDIQSNTDSLAIDIVCLENFIHSAMAQEAEPVTMSLVDKQLNRSPAGTISI